jgi:hypothetical protein
MESATDLAQQGTSIGSNAPLFRGKSFAKLSAILARILTSQGRPGEWRVRHRADLASVPLLS